MQNTPICSDPRIIVNSVAIDLILKHHQYYLDGQLRFFTGRTSKAIDFFKSMLSRFSKKFTLTQCLNSSAVNPVTAEMVCLYQLVPCGHCPNCIMSKRYSFVQRCQFESLSHPHSFPFFVTLTYRDECLPFVYSSDADGFGEMPVPSLDVRDVQLFFKRFRQNLARKFDGRYDVPIRYALCGEYGRRTGRPHYHFLLWGLPASSSIDVMNVSKLIEDSWKKGFVKLRVISGINDKAFRYTSKYMCKSIYESNMISDDQKRVFLNCSNRNGGLGRAFLKKFSSYMNKSLDIDLKYLDTFSGQSKSVFFNSWSLNVLFPSLCRIVPSQVRKAAIELNSHPELPFVHRPFVDGFVNSLNEYFFIPKLPDFGYDYQPWQKSLCVLLNFLNRNCLNDFHQFRDFLKQSRTRSDRREQFFFELSSRLWTADIDLKARNDRSRQDINRSFSLEQL